MSVIFVDRKQTTCMQGGLQIDTVSNCTSSNKIEIL